MKKCVALVSGGLDSAVMLAMIREMGYENIYALSFDYGQRHRRELEYAAFQAVIQRVDEYKIVMIDLGQLGGSSLTDMSISVPRDRDLKEKRVPSTYVPARNTIFLSFALAWAEILGAQDIFIGANALDYQGYPDCRPEFFEAYEKMANLSTVGGSTGENPIHIKTPIINMSKQEIVAEGLRLGIDFSRTSSCYDPDFLGRSCGHCDACRLRLEAFEKLGANDPIEYSPGGRGLTT